MPLVIRPIESGDREAWARLFRGYRDFYALEPDESVIDAVWRWLLDDAHEVQGLIAVRDGVPVGLAVALPSSWTTCSPTPTPAAAVSALLSSLVCSGSPRMRGCSRFAGSRASRTRLLSVSTIVSPCKPPSAPTSPGRRHPDIDGVKTATTTWASSPPR
jgi:hypothetical protein